MCVAMKSVPVAITREEIEAAGIDLLRGVKVRAGRHVFAVLPDDVPCSYVACTRAIEDFITPAYAVDVWQFGGNGGRFFADLAKTDATVHWDLLRDGSWWLTWSDEDRVWLLCGPWGGGPERRFPVDACGPIALVLEEVEPSAWTDYGQLFHSLILPPREFGDDPAPHIVAAALTCGLNVPAEAAA